MHRRASLFDEENIIERSKWRPMGLSQPQLRRCKLASWDSTESYTQLMNLDSAGECDRRQVSEIVLSTGLELTLTLMSLPEDDSKRRKVEIALAGSDSCGDLQDDRGDGLRKSSATFQMRLAARLRQTRTAH